MNLGGFRPQSTDIELVQPPTDSISRIKFSPVPTGSNNLLAVASWDNAVRSIASPG